MSPGKITDYYKIVEETRELINNASDISANEKKDIITLSYGHIADGDITINVAIPGYDNEDLLQRLNAKVFPFMMDFTRRSRGSIGGEGGVGVLMRDYLHYSKSQELIDTMQIIKRGLDPKGIMNPYKLFN